MVTKRQVRQEGHNRKFLAVADNTAECARAIHYAARRSAAIGADLILVYVIAPADFQHWLGVEEVMRSEARAEAEATLAKYADLAIQDGCKSPETVIREGPPAHEIVALIEEDPDIALLILAAGDDNDGPGPLVSSVAGTGAIFPIPVTVVPATLTDQDIDDLV
ncbi:universal stress protein [Pseudahrensia aquimaris]|uniref:Universal stress protein n=1 Tax=Pseudahrensia aquimaris TaxID=744461 RepID=A0ABW3FEN4_9HYPH